MFNISFLVHPQLASPTSSSAVVRKGSRVHFWCSTVTGCGEEGFSCSLLLFNSHWVFTVRVQQSLGVMREGSRVHFWCSTATGCGVHWWCSTVTVSGEGLWCSLMVFNGQWVWCSLWCSTVTGNCEEGLWCSLLVFNSH